VGAVRYYVSGGDGMSKSFDNLRETQEMLANHYKHIKVDADRIFYTDISDIHLGHKGFDTKTFDNLIEVIQSIPNFYVFLGGDTINHANKGSKSSPFEENMTPREQIKGQYEYGKLTRKGIIQYLEPIKDRIIGKIDGNHDGTRSQEFNDTSPGEWMSDLLGIPYFGDLALIQFSVRKNAYTHFHHHITGSAGKKINLNKLQEKGEEWRCDVIWGEHTHRRQWGSEYYVDIDLRNQKPIIRKQYFLNTNSLLGWSGYAKTKGYRLGITGIKVIEMSGLKNNRYIRVYDEFKDFYDLVVKG
jgi:predicted phosphodiesterase